LEIAPLPWQRWLLIHAMELRPDGRFRFRTVVVLVARQNGKTTIVEVKNLWKMFVLGVPLVIGTAQNLDIAEESWDKAVEIVESIPELAAEVAHVDKTNGKKALKLVSGSRWKIAAASRRGGRGLSGDDVNLDELREHQNWLAWGAVTKTTMARADAQIWAFSNAGDDKSVVLNNLRATGKALIDDPLTDPSIGLFEWSAPDEVKCTCDRVWTEEDPQPHKPTCRLWDRKAWAQANPSLGYTITEEAISSALTTDPEEIFRTEVLCQHVDDLQPYWQVISEATWNGLADDGSVAGDRLAFAIAVTPGGTHAAIGVVGERGDGLDHVEVVEHRRGTGWVVERVAGKPGDMDGGLVGRWKPLNIVIDPGSPAGFLIPELEDALTHPEAGEPRAELLKTSARDVAQATGAFIAACGVAEGDKPTLRYRPHPALDAAVKEATTKPLGDGRKWHERTASADISPLRAVTLARWGLVTADEEEEAVEPWAMYG
jgi:hypothetical protein